MGMESKSRTGDGDASSHAGARSRICAARLAARLGAGRQVVRLRLMVLVVVVVMMMSVLAGAFAARVWALVHVWSSGRRPGFLFFPRLAADGLLLLLRLAPVLLAGLPYLGCLLSLGRWTSRHSQVWRYLALGPPVPWYLSASCVGTRARVILCTGPRKHTRQPSGCAARAQRRCGAAGGTSHIVSRLRS